MIQDIDETFLLPLHPAGKLGLPREVAELVLFLVSEKASFITGSYYQIDGGYLAQ
jgi:NAD(P)-dependent dehydrogenase (short-subunit alcohol dehydrogenase family)